MDRVVKVVKVVKVNSLGKEGNNMFREAITNLREIMVRTRTKEMDREVIRLNSMEIAKARITRDNKVDLAITTREEAITILKISIEEATKTLKTSI